MAFYSIEFKKSVKRDLKHLPKGDIQKILKSIRGLAYEPRPPQSKKLTSLNRYRLRSGRYRVLYEIKDQLLLITVIKVRHRKHVYR